MKCNWNLKTPSEETSSIRLVVHHRGKTYNKSIGITIPTKQWKVPKKGPQFCTDTRVAAKMRKIDLYLQTHLNDFSTDEEVRRVLSGISAGSAELPVEQSEHHKTFWEFYDEFVLRERPNLRQFKSVNKMVGEIMGRRDDWNDINADWERRLIEGMNEREYSDNYKAGIIAKIKTVMQEAYDLGLHTNLAFKKFHKHYTPADSIWLTAPEIEALWELELKGMDAMVRDLFLLGFYTASRFSDYSRLDMSMIRDGVIHIVSKKTNVESLIPCSPRVVEILKRNHGHAPRMSQQELNREIKMICCRARINEPTTTTIVKGGKQVTTTQPKYALVTSHTARRSAATQLVLAGVPEKSVMYLTGHTNHTTFAAYIRMSKEQNAQMLRDNPFFQ